MPMPTTVKGILDRLPSRTAKRPSIKPTRFLDPPRRCQGGCERLAVVEGVCGFICAAYEGHPGPCTCARCEELGRTPRGACVITPGAEIQSDYAIPGTLAKSLSLDVEDGSPSITEEDALQAHSSTISHPGEHFTQERPASSSYAHPRHAAGCVWLRATYGRHHLDKGVSGTNYTSLPVDEAIR